MSKNRPNKLVNQLRPIGTIGTQNTKRGMKWKRGQTLTS